MHITSYRYYLEMEGRERAALDFYNGIKIDDPDFLNKTREANERCGKYREYLKNTQMPYPDEIMRFLRKAHGLEFDDTHDDVRLFELPVEQIYRLIQESNSLNAIDKQRFTDIIINLQQLPLLIAAANRVPDEMPDPSTHWYPLDKLQKRNFFSKIVVKETAINELPHLFRVVLSEPPFIIEIPFRYGVPFSNDATVGVTDTDLLEIIRHRLDGKFDDGIINREEQMALNHIEEALMWLNKRVTDAIAYQNVAGIVKGE